jgi:hypothetical protein
VNQRFSFYRSELILLLLSNPLHGDHGAVQVASAGATATDILAIS